jgi:hypothetical protein
VLIAILQKLIANAVHVVQEVMAYGEIFERIKLFVVRHTKLAQEFSFAQEFSVRTTHTYTRFCLN